ncbi:MAG TPA: hypothetical protein ENK54_07510 [Thiotrichales bacterium]|nr:hypothetical protein [Thiotrichales bacterium]
MSRFLMALALALASLTTSAKDIDGRHAVYGAGAQGCAQWLKVRSQEGSTVKLWIQWLEGYLSAFNVTVGNTYSIIGERGFDEVLDWLDSYCKTNPDHLFVTAVANLTVQLFPERYNLPPDRKGSSWDKWQKGK